MSADGAVPRVYADDEIDPGVQCVRCDAVCCRLQVVVMPEDPVPRHFVDSRRPGLNLMAKGEDGWCAALDPVHMRCSIYELRPAVCRRFAMGSAYCRDERDQYSRGIRRPIPLTLR
ncbi:YkgJ family cysteine cluster protein [Coralloluteibacterium thermophilus]|uniref:YkgJ family cysteine cluster protein n=1 Tax=Coralloluteibacterium thermophilum TaxID=2707049 RepID=A0ABV9NN16_9GAMM